MAEPVVLQSITDLPASTPVAWVGGAMDSTTRLLARFVPPKDMYFQWFEGRALSRWLRLNPNAVVIAHSYGASTAAHVIAKGAKVDMLITLDPVGWHKPQPHLLQQHCRLWLNFAAGQTAWNFVNLVARCGGWWQQWPARYTALHSTVDGDHATLVAFVLARYGVRSTDHVV